MIRIVVVDDHPALRAGLSTVLRAEPGLVHVGASGGDDESLWPVLDTARPDVVLLDFHLPGADGLQLCLRIKERLLAPKVVLYSAHAGRGLALPAALAGADALTSKAAPARELFEVIRRVARGERVLPPVTREQLDQASEQIGEEDLPVLGLLLQGASRTDIAAALALPVAEVPDRIRRLLGALRPPIAQDTL